MNDVTFYFQVHQPFRLRGYRFFDIGNRDDYFDDEENERILRRVAEKCYLPMNALLLRAIERTDGAFRCSFSISGTALDQFEAWSPETLESFRALAATGHVEFLAETSHHSLSALFDEAEFRAQLEDQAARIERLFGVRPKTFRNTELVIDNRIARIVEEAGYIGILGEGADHLLGWRSPHVVYRPQGCERIKSLLRSYRLSDDIAFRFSNRGWDHWPLHTETFCSWLEDAVRGLDEQVIGLFMDYETFGEHQWEDTGIFSFMEALPEAVLATDSLRFATPGEVFERNDPMGRIDVPHPVSWADAERDLTAWLGNHMQRAANEALWDIGADLRQVLESPDALDDDSEARELLVKWRRLTTSDHLYYMCTKWFSDGDVHKYFSPYSTPHDAFIAFMNVLDDLARRIEVLREAAITTDEGEALGVVELTPRGNTQVTNAEAVACGEGKV
ncbi:MAG: glycoside hydrolase family 57 protein [Planctomycetes bacterium]|nr:glycoside hydrolase family 57 protein [Planctomycetota bacterium]